MNKRLIGLLAGATMLVACGSDNNAPNASSVCSKLQTTWPGLQTKVSQCPEIQAELAQYSNVPVQQQACMTAVAACTSDDFVKLNTFLDCMDTLPNCTTATLQTWGTSFTGCYTQLQAANLTTACRTPVGL